MTDETIFAVALEKPDAAERAAYLDSACAGDAEQRKRVEGLLAALDAAGGFLEKPAVVMPESDAAPTRAFHAAGSMPSDGVTRTHGGVTDEDTDDALGFLQPAQRPDSLGRIGHYEVLEVLGRGGFGIVFRAFDEVLQRVVAVKVLAPSMAATSPARKRFIREARSAARIQHENVVRVHDVSRDDERLPYLVMEFISGETLQQRLDRTGPLDVPEVVRIGRQIAEGLAAAHATGLIHRDIKPSNILIDSGPTQQAKITDFGLARAADDASISQSGIVAGTPMYMAPEQAKGDSLDHRADLFSLGSVLYVMCSGRPPFRASGTLAVLKRVCEENPRPIREIIPEVPEWLCRIIEKLHAKNPDERFQTAKEVADVLADCEKQLQAHAGVKDLSRIPEAKVQPVAPHRSRPGMIGIVAGLAALVFLVLWLGQFAMLYATDQGQIRFSIGGDLDVERVLVRRDGEVVATLDRANPEAKLPPGDYDLEGICDPGYEATKFNVSTKRFYTISHQFSRTEANNTLRLTVRRGDTTTIAVIAERRTAPPSPQPDKDGFVALFNGKDLTGWTTNGDPKDWEVTGGFILCKGTDGGATGKISALIRTVKEYENYVLKMQWRCPRPDEEAKIAKSSWHHLYLHIGPKGPVPNIHFIQNNDGSGWLIGEFGGQFKLEKPAGPLQFGIGKSPRFKFPANGRAFGEWNDLVITARDGRVTIESNGEHLVTAAECNPRKGHIGMEAHGAEFHYRNIEIKELPPPSSPTPEQQAREEAAKLNGEWVVRGGRMDGLPLVADGGIAWMKLSLKDGKFILPIRADDGYPWALTGTYSIDAAKKQLAFKFNHEPLDTLPVLSSYRFEGDALVLDFPEPKVGDGATGRTYPFAPDRRVASRNNLYQIGVAMHNYLTEHDDAFPPAAITSPKDGKPLLSWRVALLPYLDKKDLYRQFRLDEPWDSENNKKLIEKMPKVFKTPGVAAQPGQTHYRVFVGPGTAFEPRPPGARGVGILAFDDGTSGTILVVEAATHPVVWTKPDELPYDPKKPLPKLVGADSVETHVLMADGSVCRMLPEAWAKEIRVAIERSDGVATSKKLFPRIPRNGPALYLEFRRAAAAPPAVAPEPRPKP